MGKYPGESDSNEPIPAGAFYILVGAAVVLIVSLVITVLSDFGSTEYTQGYNDALRGNSSTHLQVKDIKGSERIDRYEWGYSVGTAKLQKNIQKQTNNENMRRAENLLHN